MKRDTEQEEKAGLIEDKYLDDEMEEDEDEI